MMTLGFRQSSQLCALTLGVLLLWRQAIAAQELADPRLPDPALLNSTVTNPAQPTLTYSVPTALADLAAADVVYLGETHDSRADHAAQLQLIQALYAQNPELAIGMEMFQRPYQEAIDQYLAGTLSEADLRQRTEYDQRWGFPWAYYAPILRFAKEHQLPVLALNTPTEVTRRVAQKGLDALTNWDRQWIPPVEEIRTDNAAYQQFLRPIYDDFHQGHGSSQGFENFFLAQVLWDETMAEGIANFLHANPTHQVVVLAGQGHVVYGYGIPDRVMRRFPPERELTQRLVLLNPASEFETMGDRPAADYFWFSP